MNDCARENMAAIARDFQDRNGSLVSAGSTNAYTVTTNNGNAALADIGPIAFRADRANTGAATLNVDGLGAKPLRRPNGAALASGDLYENRLVTALYNANQDQFEVQNIGEFPSGTRMLFQQSSAPPGWTKDATHNNKALRITSSSVTTGGSVDFTTAFANRSTNSIALTTTQMPFHQHFAESMQAVSHRHGTAARSQYASASSGGGSGQLWQGEVGGLTQFSGAIAVNGQTSGQGSGGIHAHDINIAVQYVDVIIAQKD